MLVNLTILAGPSSAQAGIDWTWIYFCVDT